MTTQRGKPLHVLRSKNTDAPKNATTVAIGRRLRDLRMAQQQRTGFPVSQGMIGKALGVNHHTIGRFESGVREPDVETVIVLANYLRTTPCYILFGCEHPMRPAKAPPSAGRHSGMHLIDHTHSTPH